jgi:hypothetical protein
VTGARAGTGHFDLGALLGDAAPDRLSAVAVAYLLLPFAVFLAGWAEPWLAALALLAAAAALTLATGRWWPRRAPFPRATALLLLGLGLAWAAPSGMHHLVFSMDDWQLRDAALRDLVAHGWPVAYRVDGAEWLLRAPLGYYLPAALVGKAAGGSVAAAQAALWAWTGLGLALVLALLRALAPPGSGGRGFAVMAAVFVLFSGLELPVLVLHDVLRGVPVLEQMGWTREWWAGAGLFQYYSHTAMLLWAPNHTLPGWIGVLLVLRHWRRPEFHRAAALPLVAGVFWSPFSAAGAALFAAAAALRCALPAGWRALLPFLSAANLLAAALVLPIFLYLASGAGEIRQGFAFALNPGAETVVRYALFVLLEAGVWVGLLALVLRGGWWPLGVAAGALALLPLYVLGPGNDLVFHGGVAPIAVLAIAVGLVLAAPAPTAAPRLVRLARAGLLAGMGIAALHSLNEASPLLLRPAWAASRHCSIPDAYPQSFAAEPEAGVAMMSHYLSAWPAARLAGWLRPPAEAVPVDPDPGPCWPDRPPASPVTSRWR